MRPKQRELIAALTLVFLGVFFVVFLNGIMVSNHQHFAWLAESFVHGRLDIPAERLAKVGPMDIVKLNGRYYWPLEPLPAVAMIPLLPLVSLNNIQFVAQLAVVALIAALAFRLARRRGFGETDSIWLAFALCFASVLSGVIFQNGPWFVGNAFAVLFILAALNESAGKDRPWLTGIFAGLTWLSRLTAGLGTIFFFVLELMRPLPWRARLRRLVFLALPVAAAVVLVALYNYLRFGSLFDTGHAHHWLQPGGREYLSVAAHGLFNLVNVPRNFYYYFLALPDLVRGWLPVVNPYGVSVFVLSPVFLLAFAAKKRTPEFVGAAVATIGCLVVFLTYFTTGFWQFGPRYLCDVLPYWYLLLLTVLPRRGLTLDHKVIIAVSAAANIILFGLFLAVHVFYLI